MLLQGWEEADPSVAVALDHQPLPDPIHPKNLYNRQRNRPLHHNRLPKPFNSHKVVCGEVLREASWVEYWEECFSEAWDLEGI